MGKANRLKARNVIDMVVKQEPVFGLEVTRENLEMVVGHNSLLIQQGTDMAERIQAQNETGKTLVEALQKMKTVCDHFREELKTVRTELEEVKFAVSLSPHPTAYDSFKAADARLAKLQASFAPESTPPIVELLTP